MKRRTLYALHVAGIVACLMVWHAANASPTPAQVRRAVDPAFNARRSSVVLLGITAAADIITTESALHRGCHESNRIYGPHPGLPLLIGTHALVVGAAWYGHAPAWANYTAAALFGFAAIHNAQVQCVRR